MKNNVDKDLELLICTHFQHEGLGSLYERVVLSRFMRNLAVRHGYRSVLEYSCPVTKGYDNLAFLDHGVEVTLADEHIERLEGAWRFKERRPVFSTLGNAPKADLVWNFAQIQMNDELLGPMTALSKQHVLVFVPNFLNIGTPAHLSYHLLTRTPCRHAERGSVPIRTRTGLLRFLRSQNIHIIESGYIDAPPLPDIGFSIRELKETIGWSKANNLSGGVSAPAGPASDPLTVWQRVQQMIRFETSPVVRPFKPVFGHHIYALGRIT
jgi:hypothetical protein